MNTLPSKRTLDFPDALREVIAGKRITKLEWNDRSTYVGLLEGRLKLVKSDGRIFDLVVSDGDLLGTDWTVVAFA